MVPVLIGSVWVPVKKEEEKSWSAHGNQFSFYRHQAVKGFSVLVALCFAKRRVFRARKPFEKGLTPNFIALRTQN